MTIEIFENAETMQQIILFWAIGFSIGHIWTQLKMLRLCWVYDRATNGLFNVHLWIKYNKDTETGKLVTARINLFEKKQKLNEATFNEISTQSSSSHRIAESILARTWDNINLTLG